MEIKKLKKSEEILYYRFESFCIILYRVTSNILIYVYYDQTAKFVHLWKILKVQECIECT